MICANAALTNRIIAKGMSSLKSATPNPSFILMASNMNSKGRNHQRLTSQLHASMQGRNGAISLCCKAQQ